MKNGWKVFWIICAAMGVIGMCLCIAGLSMGVTAAGIRSAFGSEVGYIEKQVIVSEDYVDTEGNTVHHGEDVDLHADHSETDQLVEHQGVRRLSIDMDAGSLMIKTYDGYEVRSDFSGVGSDVNLSTEQEGDELDIDVEKKRSRLFGNFDAGEVILYIPENYSMDEISLDIGAGEVLIGDVATYDMSIDCGAGLVTYDTSLQESDFNYRVQCGVGNVQIGDSNYAGLGSKKSIDNQSSRNIDIDCGVGEVIIKFI